MKPVMIPDALIRKGEGELRVTIGAPTGLEELVAPVEAVTSEGSLGKTISLLIELDDLDIAQLDLTKHFWLRVHGSSIPAFRIEHV